MNMSYCRFRNTRGDLSDCLGAIVDENELSKAETISGKRMFKEFLTFCRDWDIIDGYDGERVDEIFDELCEKDEDEESDD